MIHTPPIAVDAEWDDEAGVWVATSLAVPGLVAEHADLRVLRAMVVELIPILLVENGLVAPGSAPRSVLVHLNAHGDTHGIARIAA